MLGSWDQARTRHTLSAGGRRPSTPPPLSPTGAAPSTMQPAPRRCTSSHTARGSQWARGLTLAARALLVNGRGEPLLACLLSRCRNWESLHGRSTPLVDTRHHWPAWPGRRTRRGNIITGPRPGLPALSAAACSTTWRSAQHGHADRSGHTSRPACIQTWIINRPCAAAPAKHAWHATAAARATLQHTTHSPAAPPTPHPPPGPLATSTQGPPPGSTIKEEHISGMHPRRRRGQICLKRRPLPRLWGGALAWVYCFGAVGCSGDRLGLRHRRRSGLGGQSASHSRRRDSGGGGGGGLRLLLQARLAGRGHVSERAHVRGRGACACGGGGAEAARVSSR